LSQAVYALNYMQDNLNIGKIVLVNDFWILFIFYFFIDRAIEIFLFNDGVSLICKDDVIF
jgi:hypothetical protein